MLFFIILFIVFVFMNVFIGLFGFSLYHLPLFPDCPEGMVHVGDEGRCITIEKQNLQQFFGYAFISGFFGLMLLMSFVTAYLIDRGRRKQ